jgi:hypothetical protein
MNRVRRRPGETRLCRDSQDSDRNAVPLIPFCLSPRERAYGGRSRRTRRPRPLLSSLSVDLARRRARQKQWSGRRPKSESERAIFAESPAGLAGVRIQPSGRRAIVVERSIGSLELVNLLRKRERPVDPRFVDLPINHCSQDA